MRSAARDGRTWLSLLLLPWLAEAVYEQGRLGEAQQLAEEAQALAAAEDLDAQALWRVCQIFCARGFSLSGSGCLSVTIFSRYLMSCCPVYPAVPRNRTFRAVPGLMLRVPVFPASCAVAGACCLILRGSHGGPFPSVIKYSRR